MSLEAQALAMQARVIKNLRFGVARGLTNTARFAAEKMQAQLPAIFDRPTPFTQKAIGFSPATKTGLEARVFAKDKQAGYLEMQERGGVRTPAPGSPIIVPVGQRQNRFGNIPRGAIGRARLRPDVFVSRGEGKTRHLPPGIYQRPKYGKRRDGGVGVKGPLRHGGKGNAVGGVKAKGAPGLKLLVTFKRHAEYEPRFQFVERVSAIARDNVKRQIEASIAEAMATAR